METNKVPSKAATPARAVPDSALPKVHSAAADSIAVSGSAPLDDDDDDKDVDDDDDDDLGSTERDDPRLCVDNDS